MNKSENKNKEKEFKPSKELLDSLKEREIIIREIKEGKRKGYSNIKDLINVLNEE